MSLPKVAWSIPGCPTPRCHLGAFRRGLVTPLVAAGWPCLVTEEAAVVAVVAAVTPRALPRPLSPLTH